MKITFFEKFFFCFYVSNSKWMKFCDCLSGHWLTSWLQTSWFFFLFLEEESISEPFKRKFLLILHCEEIDFQSHLKNNFLTFFLFHRKNVHESLLKKIKIKIKCSLGFDTIVYNFFSVFNLQFQNNIADRLNILLKIIALLFNL